MAALGNRYSFGQNSQPPAFWFSFHVKFGFKLCFPTQSEQLGRLRHPGLPLPTDTQWASHTEERISLRKQTGNSLGAKKALWRVGGGEGVRKRDEEPQVVRWHMHR